MPEPNLSKTYFQLTEHITIWTERNEKVTSIDWKIIMFVWRTSGLIVSHVDFSKSNSSTIIFCFEKSRLYLTAASQGCTALSSSVEFNLMVTYQKKHLCEMFKKFPSVCNFISVVILNFSEGKPTSRNIKLRSCEKNVSLVCQCMDQATPCGLF